MMSKISITFDQTHKLKPINTSIGKVWRAILPIRLSYNNSSIDIEAMIDTGADFSTFSKDIAIGLGIPDDQMSKEITDFVSESKDTSYCIIQISLLGRQYDCQACFVENPKIPALIGRDTIFSKLQFAFRQSVHEFYVSLTP
jgi:hypothetical protein